MISGLLDASLKPTNIIYFFRPQDTSSNSGKNPSHYSKNRRFRGVRTVYPSPRNREIGFVSSSFSFRACRACRACGRGEAAWAHDEWCSYRWASRVRVSGFPRCLSQRFCCYLHGFNRFLVFSLCSSSFFVVICMGFKELLFFPQRLPFWVSFLPVPEWWRCNAGNPKSHPLCPPDSGQLLLLLLVFWFCADQKEKKHDSTKFPSQIKTQRQVKSQHCTFSPKSPKFQEYQNHYSKSTKIYKNLSKSIKIDEKHKKCQKKHKVKGKTT